MDVRNNFCPQKPSLLFHPPFFPPPLLGRVLGASWVEPPPLPLNRLKRCLDLIPPGFSKSFLPLPTQETSLLNRFCPPFLLISGPFMFSLSTSFQPLYHLQANLPSFSRNIEQSSFLLLLISSSVRSCLRHRDSELLAFFLRFPTSAMFAIRIIFDRHFRDPLSIFLSPDDPVIKGTQLS